MHDDRRYLRKSGPGAPFWKAVALVLVLTAVLVLLFFG